MPLEQSQIRNLKTSFDEQKFQKLAHFLNNIFVGKLIFEANRRKEFLNLLWQNYSGIKIISKLSKSVLKVINAKL